MKYDTLGRVVETADSAQVSLADTDHWQSVHVTTLFDLNSNVLSVTRSPHPSGVTGTITDSADYDNLDRVLHRYDPNKSGDQTLATILYDGIGNVVKVTRGTGADTVGYDVLGRPIYRKVSGVSNTYTPGTSSDEQHFGYDQSGNLDTATNNSARVYRTYTLGGLLASERQEIANADLSFGSHSYTIGYSYDLDGRRTTLTTPSTLTSLGSSLTYGYDPASGDLSTITSSALGTFTFANWLSGKPQFYIKPDYSVEIFQYAAPSFQRIELHLLNPSWPASHNDAYYSDGRGKTTSKLSSTFGGAWQTSNFTYSGLGSVLSTTAGFQSEDYSRDPLGNATTKNVSAPTWSASYTSTFQQNSTRVNSIVGSPAMSSASWTQALDSVVAVHYDTVGNLRQRDEKVNVPTTCGSRAPCDPPQANHVAYSHLYNDFAADGKLLKSELVTSNDAYNGVDSTNVFPYAAIGRGVFEEYRYDALGRRVWLRAHREPYCTNVTDVSENPICLSAIERFVYDGEQVLFEIRQIGGDNASATVLENDQASNTDYPDQFGIVGYLHGLSIDQPLGLVRSRPTGNTALILHRDWQGAVDFATIPSGGSQGKPIDCGRPDAVSGCEHIPWPGIDLSIGFQRPVTDIGQFNWWGTLVAGNQNATGLVDMRARQFDPKLGQFVQEDPIGTAGGLNTYGFAGGDAVNSRDPSGLDPDDDPAVLIARIDPPYFKDLEGFYMAWQSLLDLLPHGGGSSPKADNTGGGSFRSCFETTFKNDFKATMSAAGSLMKSVPTPLKAIWGVASSAKNLGSYGKYLGELSLNKAHPDYSPTWSGPTYNTKILNRPFSTESHLRAIELAYFTMKSGIVKTAVAGAGFSIGAAWQSGVNAVAECTLNR